MNYDVPLKFMFALSLEKGIFADDLKIARITPVYKGGGRSKWGNYRSISVLPCFSKILERIMHNHTSQIPPRKQNSLPSTVRFSICPLIQ